MRFYSTIRNAPEEYYEFDSIPSNLNKFIPRIQAILNDLEGPKAKSSFLS